MPSNKPWKLKANNKIKDLISNFLFLFLLLNIYLKSFFLSFNIDFKTISSKFLLYLRFSKFFLKSLNAKD